MLELFWMPINSEWQQNFKKLQGGGTLESGHSLRDLANFRLNFAEILPFDQTLQKRFGKLTPEGLTTKPVRLAVPLTVEAHFGIKFQTAETEKVKNVGHPVELIRQKLEARKPLADD